MSNITSIETSLRRSLGRGLQTFFVLGLLALLLLGIIWSGTFHVIAVEHAAAEDAAIHSSQELLETYDAQMVRSLGAIDQTLRIVKYDFELKETHFSLPELRDEGLLPSSVVFDVSVADRNGDIGVNSRTSKSTNVAHEPYFQMHRQLDTGVTFVGKATRSSASGQWELRFSRRLNAPNGSFGGIAIVSVDPAYFTSGYERSRLGESGVVGLLGTDGEFRVTRSGDKVSSGQEVDYDAATHDAGGRLADGTLLRSPWDETYRYTSARPLHGFPLTAIVGLSQNEQLDAYYRHRRTYLWEAAVASVLLAVVITVLGSLSWQLTKSRRSIRKLQETYHAASEASVDAFYVLQTVRDASGLIIDFVFGDTNSRGEALIGMNKNALLGKTFGDIFPTLGSKGFLEDITAVALTGVIHEKEWLNAMPALHAEWLYRQVVRVEDGVVAILRDISERKRLETTIQYQATHDALTGLANRNLLHDRLNMAIAHAIRYGHSVSVVFVDLDRFKLVNDSLGHKAGDMFLLTIAERLQSTVREADTVARLGGDEFVLLLPEAVDNSLSANSVQRIMEVISQPILIGEKEFSVNCSIGIAIYPRDGDTSGLLIERADMAMYRAKEIGRNNFQFFTAAMNERLVERLRIVDALRDALERREFVLHFQPQVDLRSGRIVGAEALIRWQHPELGMISPARFIPLAEETGLIVPIGEWVVRTACEQNMAWQRAGYGNLRMAVNLSMRQFAQPDLVQSIATVLTETGLEPHRLEIELTEGLVMTDVENAVGILRDLKALGVQLAIDDFGTGYSSLSYLKRFPIDVLKIDQSFVHDIADSPEHATIVLSIISLAHNLRLRVIAEGVETDAQLAYLKKHDCDEMQGFYFSRPLPPGEFACLLRDRQHLPIGEDEVPIH